NRLWDRRFPCRCLAPSRGFATIAILTLALGIGANTAIFSAVDAVLIRPLPYHEPHRIAVVWEQSPNFPRNTPAPANFFDWQQQNQVFSLIAATRGGVASLTGDGPPESLYGREVSPDFFAVFGVPAIAGRVLNAEDEKPGDRVVVISHSLWQRRYGRDPSLINRPILVDGHKVTVVGVMPPDFRFPNKRTDYWVPWRAPAEYKTRRNSHFLVIVARLKPGVTFERAQNDMTTIASRLERQYPESNTGVGAAVIPLKDEMVQESRTALLVLLAGAATVLLIACSNVANLLLA